MIQLLSRRSALHVYSGKSRLREMFITGELVKRVGYFNQPLKSDILDCAYWHHVFHNKVGY